MPETRECQARGWWEDAVIYQVRVRSFADSNGDSIGDIQGLTDRLDYIARLGVTCLWLMPFCVSPRRDDGYDVADYMAVDPDYGTLADVDQLIAAAHARGLRVITEFVLNHTSDQHPWFQAARRAPPGSPARAFYVWSDTPSVYPDARIIFPDIEVSNWTWDPVAEAYYFHRFFAHQPDLNFDNPHVRDAMWEEVRFWCERDVDGRRLDAIAHLYQREGTSCDDLPETHAYLRHLRARLGDTYPGHALMGEVNSSPERTRAYFGSGDECHLTLHFPLSVALFEAIALGDASHLATVVEQTRDLPPGCAWATFLRSHDELALSALPEAEREALMAALAPEPDMRLNLGVRRRLAPLLGGDSRRILMAYALLFSLPGAPVIYYGDELGMGDDVSLPDRDGLRLAMPWTNLRSDGVSVDAQEGDPMSLLAQMRRLIARRKALPALRRGSVTVLAVNQPGIVAFVRESTEQRVVVVVNLRDEARAVEVQVPGDVGMRVELSPFGWVWTVPV